MKIAGLTVVPFENIQLFPIEIQEVEGITTPQISGDQSLRGTVGGWNIEGNEFSSGEGATECGMSSTDALWRLWCGGDKAAAPFRVDKNGNTFASSLTLSGGIIKFGKTSFADSAHAGYHIDSSGFYFGSAADASYLKYTIGTGVLDFVGASISSPTITGIQTGSEIAIQGWQSDLVFSATDADTAAWALGTITLMNGDTYSIDAGNTGNMAALTYVYLDIAASITVLQTTTTAATAVGTGKILIAVAQNNSDATSQATFQVFGGTGGQLVAIDNIAANSASVNELITNTAQIKEAIIGDAHITGIITVGHTAAQCTDADADETSANTAANITGQGDLATTNEADANVLNMTNAPAAANADVTQTIIDGGMITTGYITLGTGGHIKAGQTDYATGTGFFLGYSGAAHKFSLGSTSNYLRWDGVNMILKGGFDVGSNGIVNNARYTVANLPVAPTSAGFNSPSALGNSGGTWSSGGALALARMSLAGAGTQSAGLSFGGLSGIMSGLATTEEYNGSSWSGGGDLATARGDLAGCGTQSAGLSFGGGDETEEYNGSSWSAGGDLATEKDYLAGCGTQSAGLAFGGWNSTAPNVKDSTEEYNGATWSAGGDLITARMYLAGCGTQSAGLAFGGWNGGDLATTEEYNGAAWAGGGSLGTAGSFLAGCGTQSAGLSFGGGDSFNITEQYNGVAWTTTDTLNTGRSFLAGAGTQSAGLSFGGSTGHNSAITEEYTALVNPANAYSSNNVYATDPAASGVVYVSLSKDAGANYQNELSKTFTGSEGSQTYGDGDTELWGAAWTTDEINSANFRLKIRVAGSQEYKTFGFAMPAGKTLTGIEITVEAKWNGTTTSIDHVQMKVYYGTSTLPVQGGSQAYATDGRKAGEGAAAGTGVLVFYDESSDWCAVDTGLAVAA